MSPIYEDRVWFLSMLVMLLIRASCCFAAEFDVDNPNFPTLQDVESDQESVQCSFDTLEHLMNHLIENDFDSNHTSHLVLVCSNVCHLIYGTGNPDVSGIGAIISYGIQAVAVFAASTGLFVTVFFLASRQGAWATVKDISQSSKPLLRSLGLLSESIHKTSVALSLAVIYACAARVRQPDVSYSEMTVMVCLSRFQFYISGLSLQFFDFFSPEHPAGRSSKNLRILFPAVFALGSYLAFLIITFNAAQLFKQDSVAKADILNNIMMICVRSHSFPTLGDQLGLLKFTSRNTNVAHDVFVDHTWACIADLILLPWAIFSVASVAAYIQSTSSWDELVRNRARNRPPLPVGPLASSRTVLSASVVIYLLVPMALQVSALHWSFMRIWKFRKLLIKALILVNPTYQAEEEAWGFGQIAAALVWVPVAQDVISAAWEYSQVRDKSFVAVEHSFWPSRPSMYMKRWAPESGNPPGSRPVDPLIVPPRQ